MKFLMILLLTTLSFTSIAADKKTFAVIFDNCQITYSPLFNDEKVKFGTSESESLTSICSRDSSKKITCKYFKSNGDLYNQEEFNVAIDGKTFLQLRTPNGSTRIDVVQTTNNAVLSSINYIEHEKGIIAVSKFCSGLYLTQEELTALLVKEEAHSI